MAVKIPKMAAAAVPTPVRYDVVELFFDTTDDVVKFKDSKGVVRTAIAPTGSPVSLVKQASAPVAAMDTSKLYAKEVSGYLEVFARDNTGAEVQLTNQGVPAASGGSVGVFWDAYDQLKTDVTTTNSTYGLVMPTPLAPPPGQWCFFVVTLRMADAGEGNWPSGVGGEETDIVVLFDDSVGTPDVRMYGTQTGYLGNIVDISGFSFNNLAVDSSGVVTITIDNNAAPGTSAGKFAVTVAGPFVHPQMVNPNPA